MDRINIFIDGKHQLTASPHALKAKQRIKRDFHARGLKAHFDKTSIKDTAFGQIHTYHVSRSILTRGE